MTKLGKILEDAIRDGFKKALDLSEGTSRTSSPRQKPRETPSPVSLDLDSLGERS